MKNQILGIVCAMLTSHFAFSQLTLDGQFRPRTEYRHGFGSVIPKDADPGYGISTRIRLNTGYKFKSYEFYASLQDVMVWGENRQIKPYDLNNSFAVFEAWAKVGLGEKFSTKLGRQVLSYDDQRIMGGLDWAQQGRNHDAALISYRNSRFMADLGVAYNQDYDNPTGFQSVDNTYNTTGFFSYKTMQYLYLKQQGESLSASLLLLNNGFQNYTGSGDTRTGDGQSYLQTLGTHLEFKKGIFNSALNAFIQTGDRQGDIDVKGAYLVGLELGFKIGAGLTLGAGAELISGDDGLTSGQTGAFFPLYGTNHKFNGFMDYFYVGNHANSVGLFDVHISANISFGEKSSLFIKALNFNGHKALPSGRHLLGNEVDLVYSHSFQGFALKVGYSQMFPEDGMYELKGVAEEDAADIQNWAWAMLVFKPKFLNGNNP